MLVAWQFPEHFMVKISQTIPVVTSGPEILKHETNSRGSNGAKTIALRLAVLLGFCNFHFLRMPKLGYFGVSQLKLKERFELDVCFNSESEKIQALLGLLNFSYPNLTRTEKD